MVAALCLPVLLSGCSSLRIGDDAADRSKLLTPRENVRQLPEVPVTVTPEVRREMARYSRDRKTWRVALSNRRRYERMMREIFHDEGVPSGLINLGFVESNYDPTQTSPAGAAGMWQFMKETGRLYGLEVGAFEDQRRDPILSTIAAARHLYDLYEKFGDWYLAIAAYNMGPTGVESAMRRSGARDFFELAQAGALCRETTQYVYRFLAVYSMMIDLDMHRLHTYGDSSQPAGERIARGISNWSGD